MERQHVRNARCLRSLFSPLLPSFSANSARSALADKPPVAPDAHPNDAGCRTDKNVGATGVPVANGDQEFAHAVTGIEPVSRFSPRGAFSAGFSTVEPFGQR